MSRKNRLSLETSPYLLQHQSNPVDWYPWGQEALERAQREERPILLSVGYAACHWCHVMERESFEDEEVAKLMNDHFVCIKVDREERPDVDEIYMAATVALTGSGGWPMTVFLTPNKRPFFAGTYFPKENRWGRPGFKTVLSRLAELWATERESLLEQAQDLMGHLEAHAAQTDPLPVGLETLFHARKQLERAFDERHGGFGTAPKFPPSSSLSLLLREHRRSGNQESLKMVTRTLDAMAQGGIYDHVGGGFARYSTDERWFLPHFEKMLYDNAQLARVYLEAYQVTGNSDYARVARETLDYVLREMQSPGGGYYSATDADSEGEEGKFFVWQHKELEGLLTHEEFRVFELYYDVSEAGNWEGKNLLHTPRPKAEVATLLGLALTDFETTLQSARAKVYLARSRRVPPLLDDKILVSWNALMLGSMAEAFRVLGDPRYLSSAVKAADFLHAELRRKDGKLFRTHRAGRSQLSAYLEDYAFLCDALITLYEASGAQRYLTWATELAETMVEDFGDPSGGAFFHTSHHHEKLLVRLREGQDSALPNPNAVAALALARLADHTDRREFLEEAKVALLAYGEQIERAPRAFATSLSALEQVLTPASELVIAANDREEAAPILAELSQVFLPVRVIGWALPENDAQSPLLQGKSKADGLPTLYVCKNYNCQTPLTDPARIRAALEQERRPEAERRLGNLLSGRATKEATSAYRALFVSEEKPGEQGEPLSSASALPEGMPKATISERFAKFSDLWVSRIGLGSYRLEHGNQAYREAVALALKAGINLIDTAVHYGNGSSERLIGEVLHQLVQNHELAREQVVVISKVGHIQGPSLELAKERQKTDPLFEVISVDSDVWHSIDPHWVEEELTRSLERMGLDSLDGLLLHNPEQFLISAAAASQDQEETRSLFYRRIERAFAALEREVERGRLGFYGISSNTLAYHPGDPAFVDLSRLHATARSVKSEHHFRVIELPINLLEPAALKSPEPGKPSLLEEAQRLGLYVLGNRPLNALHRGSLLRLNDPPESLPVVDWEGAIQRLSLLEQEFVSRFSSLVAPGQRGPKPLLNWAEGLKEAERRMITRQQFLDLKSQLIEPHVHKLGHALTELAQGDARNQFVEFFAKYLEALTECLVGLERLSTLRTKEEHWRLRATLAPAFDGSVERLTMSQLALSALLSLNPPLTVLLGMRRVEHVADALGAMAAPRLTQEGQRLLAGGL